MQCTKNIDKTNLLYEVPDIVFAVEEVTQAIWLPRFGALQLYLSRNDNASSSSSARPGPTRPPLVFHNFTRETIEDVCFAFAKFSLSVRNTDFFRVSKVSPQNRISGHNSSHAHSRRGSQQLAPLAEDASGSLGGGGGALQLPGIMFSRSDRQQVVSIL